MFVATVYFLHLWKIGESPAVGRTNTCTYDISEILPLLSSANSLIKVKSLVTKVSPDITFTISNIAINRLLKTENKI